MLEGNVWDTFYSIQSTGPSYLSPREYFNEHGTWIGSPEYGYDFACDDDCGYIRYWSDIKGDVEFIYKVPIARYLELLKDFVYGVGLDVMKEYEECEPKDLLDAIYREVV